ncbi:MAG: Omp28-related outer membrane protein [Muribaculaceae bacterium]|nr:Omp28-related outer membrane protein [Muribaculaceae bacterium]
MKKFSILFAIAALSAASVNADDLSVGYCDGGLVETALSGASSVAIRFPESQFPMYKGTRIIGARIGLMTDAMKGVDVFLRSELNGEDILKFHTGMLYKGWSDIYFDEPAIWPDGNLCAGYELTPNLAAGISHVGTLGIVPESIWALDEGVWKDLTPDGGMPLCIQLIVEGDSYTRNDVALLGADELVAETGKAFEIAGLLRNNTTDILTSARLSCDWGEGLKEADAVVEEVLPGEIGYFYLPMPEMGLSGKLEGKISVVSVAGKPDEYAFNNDATVSITAVSNIVPRKVLIEEFTGQNCPNCPSGKERVEGGLRHLDNVVLICHHIGFGEDRMTARGSRDLLFFYGRNDGSSYAPAIMFDRTPTSGEPGPVTTIPESKSISERIIERQKTGAQVTIGIEQTYNAADRELSIDVALQQVKGMPLSGNTPVLTVALIENGVIAFQSPNYDDYEHNEVVRQFVTAPLGDEITLSAEEPTTYSYTAKISPDFNEKNMAVVAFVSNYNSANPNNCEVYNAETAPLPEDSGIAGTISTENAVDAIYDLTGNRLRSMQPGLNIVRYSDGTTKKVLIKTR